VAHNFLVFIPVENAGILRPIITEVHPWPGEAVPVADHEIRAMIVNRDGAVNVATIQVKLNGAAVGASIQPGEGMVTVRYPVTGLGPRSTNVVELQFADNVGVVQTESWSYTISGDGVPRLEAAVEVVGPYVWEPSAVADLEEQTIRVVAPAQPTFYRLSVTGGSEPGPMRIESTRVENGHVVLNYGW
jgi:hypothetical protein